MTSRVALIGAGGHGRSHRRALAPLHADGVIELVALCDLAPVRDEPDAPVPDGAALFTDYRQLLAKAEPDVVVICTPPHTHLEIAVAAARAGADLLLEKPPVLSVAEHAALLEVLAHTGRVCQVGFQALGSAALAALSEAARNGELGSVSAVSAAAAWQRPDSYYQRAAWAGRRTVGGTPVLDGALANPFAHAVMQCLAVAEAVAGAPVWPVEIELETYRARPIEVDDTAVLRLRLDHGPPVLVAVTLCADEFIAGEVVVHAQRGQATLGYTTDELRLPGQLARHGVAGRVGLLQNLLAHRASPATPLVAPLRRTAAFTGVLEVIAAAPPPIPIDEAHLRADGEGAQRVVTVAGVSEVMRQAAGRLLLPSELAVAWSAPPHRTTTTRLQARDGPVPG